MPDRQAGKSNTRELRDGHSYIEDIPDALGGRLGEWTMLSFVSCGVKRTKSNQYITLASCFDGITLPMTERVRMSAGLL
jgi:hypothetical protein